MNLRLQRKREDMPICKAVGKLKVTRFFDFFNIFYTSKALFL